MRSLVLHLGTSLVALALASACSSAAPTPGDATFPEAPLATITSDHGKLKIAAWTSPDQPPTRGIIVVRLLVTDATSGASVDGLAIAIAPDMPSMGHGTPMTPTVSASGDGVYLASDVDLFMAGAWELPMTITGTVTESAVLSLDVR